MSIATTALITIVQIEDGPPIVSLSVTIPGLMAPERYTSETRIPAPQDVMDWRDWVRQAVAAFCETI